jgi:hypothetical protein
METSDYISCTGIYKKICAAIYSSEPCVMIVGGPGCGKSSFTRSLLSERGFKVADVSDIYEKEAVSKFVKSFCGKGGLDTILSTGDYISNYIIFYYYFHFYNLNNPLYILYFQRR